MDAPDQELDGGKSDSTLMSGQQGHQIEENTKSVKSNDVPCQPLDVGYTEAQTSELKAVEESHNVMNDPSIHLLRGLPLLLDGTSGVLDPAKLVNMKLNSEVCYCYQAWTLPANTELPEALQKAVLGTALNKCLSTVMRQNANGYHIFKSNMPFSVYHVYYLLMQV